MSVNSVNFGEISEIQFRDILISLKVVDLAPSTSDNFERMNLSHVKGLGPVFFLFSEGRVSIEKERELPYLACVFKKTSENDNKI